MARSLPRPSSRCSCKTCSKAISPIRSTAATRHGAAWAMIGFPGAHYDYSEWVTAYNKPVPVPTGRPRAAAPAGREADRWPKRARRSMLCLSASAGPARSLASNCAMQVCTVLALERGGSAHDAGRLRRRPSTRTSCATMWRHHLFQNVRIRRSPSATMSTRPRCRCGSSAPSFPAPGLAARASTGTARSGAGCELDFKLKSHNEARYGKQSTAALTLQDMPLDLLRSSNLTTTCSTSICGTSGQAGNLKGAEPGRRQSVRSPAQSRDYPNPPLPMTYGPNLFDAGGGRHGLHPFPHPAGNLSRPIPIRLALQLGKCTFCGFCEKFGCGNYSKASPQTTLIPYILTKPNFELRTECEVAESRARRRTASTPPASPTSTRRHGVLPAGRNRRADRLPAAQRPSAAGLGHRHSPTIPRRARAWSARTTATRP